MPPRELPSGRGPRVRAGAGLTLVEVVVALLILQTGVMAVLGTLVLSSGTLRRAERLERATGAAEAILDSLWVGARPDTSSRELGDVALEWRVGVDGEVTIEARDERGGELLVLRSTVPVP